MTDTRLPTYFISHGGGPLEQHLLPLMAAPGAAEGEAAMRVYRESGFFGGIKVSSYRFG